MKDPGGSPQRLVKSSDTSVRNSQANCSWTEVEMTVACWVDKSFQKMAQGSVVLEAHRLHEGNIRPEHVVTVCSNVAGCPLVHHVLVRCTWG